MYGYNHLKQQDSRPKAAKDIQIGLQIYGPGKLWFDDVRVEFVSLESPK